jgi:hypothetical protein
MKAVTTRRDLDKVGGSVRSADREWLIGAIRADPALRAQLTRRLGARARLRLAAEIATSYVTVRRRIHTVKLPEHLALLRGDLTHAGVPAWRAPYEHIRAVRLGQAVARHLPRLPGETRCLTQALVLTALLAKRGIDAKVVIAVSPAPDFRAHAWVEHLGVPVLPPGDFHGGRLVEL